MGAKVAAVDRKTGWLFFASTPGGFYAKSNSILQANMNLDKPVLMHLLYTNCVSSLTFAAEVKQLTANDMRTLNTAVNDSIRRIFSFNRWESVRTLRMNYGYDSSLYEITFEKRKIAFHRGLETHPNATVRCVFSQLVVGSITE